MQRDQYPARTATSSAREFFQIVPDDDNDLAQIPRAIWVGTGGNIALVGPSGSAPRVMKNVASGSRLDVSPTRVMLAGTTAQDLEGWV